MRATAVNALVLAVLSCPLQVTGFGTFAAFLPLPIGNRARLLPPLRHESTISCSTTASEGTFHVEKATTPRQCLDVCVFSGWILSPSKLIKKQRNDEMTHVMTEAEADAYLLKQASRHIGMTSCTFAAFLEGNIVGAVTVLLKGYDPQFRPTVVHMESLFVEEQVRSQGIGASLMSKVLDYAKAQSQLTTMTLNVESDNLGAIKLYERNGFVIDDKLWNGQFYMVKSIER